MSSIWFVEGLKKGKKTEKFPAEKPLSPPLRPSRMEGVGDAECPTRAIENGTWTAEKCIFCRRCEPNYEPSGDHSIYQVKKSEKLLRKSIYLFKVDSGACGACNSEFSSIFESQYDANRLKIFETNTPRHADALVVMGVLTQGMRDALERAYDAMPEPKLIIALGACAITGGVIGKAPLDRKKYSVEISGCPPSPYTILEAIDRARGDRND